ncbi:MAG: NAD(P)-binding domain-containing protein [Thermoleophilia bacterium]|nr:NAD(P)-binding domain-containing protein [Thermoleophilia bacterium]
MRIAIVGGTGTFGRALVHRLRGLDDVVIGSRDASRAREIGVIHGVAGAANEDAVREAELVVLAVRSNAAVDTARELAGAIGTTPLLSVGADLRFTDVGVLPGRLGRSLAEEIADIVEGPVAAGLQTLAAAHLVQADPPEEDALVCGDEPACGLAMDVAARLIRGRVFNVGPLANARALEGLTSVILNVNKRHRGAMAGIRLTGVP